MKDRQLQLAEQDYAGMLRRVGVLAVVDVSKGITIAAIGEAKASISGLVIHCRQTDNTMKAFNILAGEVPNAVPGAANLCFYNKDIIVKNIGTLGGTLYIKVTDDAGKQIYYGESAAAVGAEVWNTLFAFDMPYRVYVLTVEVGHL